MDQPSSHQARQLSADLIDLFNQARSDLKAVAVELQAQSARKLRLVTRQEFDVQKSVLLNARIQLNELEQRVNALESPISQSAKPLKPAAD